MYFYALTKELQPTFVVFRDIGQAAIVRSWSNEFSSEFGGGAPGDNLLEFSNTVIRDIGQLTTRPETDDFSIDFGPGIVGDNMLAFGTTLYAPAVGGVEWLSTINANYISFIEQSSSTIIVSAGPIVPVEWVGSTNSSSWVPPVEWRGSLIWDTSFPIEWRAQPVVNWVDSIEWGLSTRSDSASFIDFNMTRLASPVMPAEWRTTLFRDDPDLIEPDATTAISWSTPTEWRSSMVFTTPTPVEWSALSLRDSASPVEIPGSAIGTAISPIDFGQPAQMFTNFSVPIEFVNRIFAFYDEPIATNISRIRDATVPAEWTGNAGVTFDAAAPLEWRSAFTTDATTPVEWRRALSQDASTAVEWGLGLIITPAVTVEFNNLILSSAIIPSANAGTRTEDIPVSLEIPASSFRDVVVPVAISGSATGTTGDAISPMSFGGGFGSPLYQISIEPNITSRSDAFLPSDWLSTMLSEPETVAESTLAVVGESFVVPDTNFDVITADDATPLEWSTIGISANITVQIERISGIVADTALPMDLFGSTLSADTLSLIDWTQDTTSLTGDSSVPVDWTYHVLVDVIIGTEKRFGRKSIGTSLEPDEWEEEHD